MFYTTIFPHKLLCGTPLSGLPVSTTLEERQLSLRFPCVRRRAFLISAQAPQAMFSSSEKRVVTGLHDSVRDSFVVMFWRIYSFALTSISLRGFPLLKDIIGGFLNISFNKGWFCIKFQGFIRIPFRFHTDGW